jgi:hypothetical protein
MHHNKHHTDSPDESESNMLLSALPSLSSSLSSCLPRRLLRLARVRLSPESRSVDEGDAVGDDTRVVALTEADVVGVVVGDALVDTCALVDVVVVVFDCTDAATVSDPDRDDFADDARASEVTARADVDTGSVLADVVAVAAVCVVVVVAVCALALTVADVPRTATAGAVTQRHAAARVVSAHTHAHTHTHTRRTRDVGPAQRLCVAPAVVGAAPREENALCGGVMNARTRAHALCALSTLHSHKDNVHKHSRHKHTHHAPAPCVFVRTAAQQWPQATVTARAWHAPGRLQTGVCVSECIHCITRTARTLSRQAPRRQFRHDAGKWQLMLECFPLCACV